MGNYQLYLRDEDLEMMNELKKIAYREETDVSVILRRLMKEYVKNHGEGNPNFTLEKFEDPDFRPLPTIGEVLHPELLGKYSYDSLEEIAKAARARAWEISQEIKKRGEFFHWKLGN